MSRDASPSPTAPMPPDRLFLAARRMARHGWPVFPVRALGKTPAAPSAHPAGDALAGRCRGECGQLGHGLHDAITDVETLRHWWLRWPDANIGLSCGPAGLVVVDVDTPAGPTPARVLRDQADDDPTPATVTRPWHALHWLADRRGGRSEDLDTLIVATPTGGRHLYFHAPDTPDTGEHGRVTSGAGMTSGLGWGLDVRAWGGYVVAPPSLRADGEYLSLGGRIRPLPGWLLDALRDAGRIDVPSDPGAADGDPGAVVRLAHRTASGVAPPPAGDLDEDAGRRHGYLTAAVRGELQRVWDAPAGELNDTLTRAAFALGQLVAGYGLDPDATTDALLTAAEHASHRGKPFNETKTAATIARALAAGARTPRIPRQTTDGAGR